MLEKKFIIIDFDSTFIQVEAFDELAQISLRDSLQKEQIVKQIADITAKGMEGEIEFDESLISRIKLLSAKKEHLKDLIDRLSNKVSLSIQRNAAFLKEYANNIFIVSNGFKEFIVPIVTTYGIKEENILANTFSYDKDDYIIGLDEINDLSKNQGKVAAIKKLNLNPDEVYVIGDGYTDYEIRQAGMAKYFYAFTENVTRESVIKVADFVIPNFDEFLYQNKLPITVSYPKNRIKILLLENIHPHAYQLLKEEGYAIEKIKGSLSEEQLCNKIKDVTVLGIRSKTAVNKKILDCAERLIAIGAFCIGTNQINLDYAADKGICVFNSPYGNTRSVVEMVIGEIILLLRKTISKNNNLHNGKWDKRADNCFELRGKRLGIVGYGNIGLQLSVLAEALGMQVYYYDIVEKLQVGNAKKCNTLGELLSAVDIVTLHVDGRKENTNLISQQEIDLMKDNSILINLSRGHVIDINALVASLKKGKFLGVAIDVFPDEPKNNDEEFISELRGFDNVILTPHIGGSTEEAQFNIGDFVAKRIINYINFGDTTQSVNLPNVQMPILNDAHRLIHIHGNVPGVLAQINQLFAKYEINVLWQTLKTNERVGYLVTDINKQFEKQLINDLKKIAQTIKFRVLY